MNGRQPSTSHATSVAVTPYAGEERVWNTFVERSPAGTFFHLAGWRDVLEQAFGYRTRYLVARRGEEIVGVLPLCELSKPFGGSCLLSLPFAAEAGVCAADAEAQRALEQTAVDLGITLGASYLELRDGLDGEDFVTRTGPYYRFRRELAASDRENLLAVPRKQRRMIRVGQRSGLVVRLGTADIEAFHDLYARSVRRLGTPVFSCDYFRLLCERFGEACMLLTVHHGGTPAAGVLSFLYKDVVMPYYAGSRRELYRSAVNDFLYWELMREALRRGLRIFDFGRGKRGTGAYAFKQHWGFNPEPLRYRAHPCGRRLAEQRSLDDAPMKWLRRAWSRLPLSLTKLLGPTIVRRFGPYYT